MEAGVCFHSRKNYFNVFMFLLVYVYLLIFLNLGLFCSLKADSKASVKNKFELQMGNNEDKKLAKA